MSARNKVEYAEMRIIDRMAGEIKQLETELSEARAEIERKDALIEQMREALVTIKENARASGIKIIAEGALEAAEMRCK